MESREVFAAKRSRKMRVTEMATKKCPICDFEVGHHRQCPNGK